MLKIDNETLKARVEKIEHELRAQGLQGLVLYANGSALGNQSFMHGYLRYLCDFDGHNTPAMLILRPGHAPVLLTGNKPYLRAHVAEKSLWFRDVRHVRPQLFGAEAAAILARQPETAGRVAYLGYDETPAPVWKSLEAGLPGVTWVDDFAPHFDKHRIVKQPPELALHRRAAAICDLVFETLAREAGAGRAGYQLQAAMEHTARHEGCDYCTTWITVSPHADASRYNIEECMRVPQAGDQIVAGILLTYDGHWGHAVRTGSFGAPSADQKRVYGICREMHTAALTQLRPGADLCEANAAMDQVLHRHYRDDDVRRSRFAHGLGYSYEDPVVTLAFPNPWDAKQQPARKPEPIEAKPGMLMELHPNLFVPGVAGAMIGDMVLITETGHELLTRFPREHIDWTSQSGVR